LSVDAGWVRLFALSFVVSGTGVVRYHGIRPSDTMKKRVFVANHSSMIDVTMLLQRDNYSLVGQAHKGWLRFIQRVMLASLQCVWFDRGETKDRNIVFEKIQKHAKNENGDLPVRKFVLFCFICFFDNIFCFCSCSSSCDTCSDVVICLHLFSVLLFFSFSLFLSLFFFCSHY
jgi:1-acyl-sn-glycerol-3-phosphate acyltransferase